MKKATLDATDENILQSIADQIGNRNARVFEFIKTLDSIMTIDLSALMQGGVKEKLFMYDRLKKHWNIRR